MNVNLIASVAICIMSLLTLSACSSSQTVEPVQSVEIKKIEIQRPAPIIPNVDQLKLRSVNWTIITPENINEKFSEIKDGELVFFALTKEGYENLSLNLGDVRSSIEQYKQVIAIYKKQF
jgi:hypothetical protein